jgi:hypothetical protein
MIAAGVPDKELHSVIGHTDIRTAKNAYGNLLDGALDDVRNRVDTFLARGR